MADMRKIMSIDYSAWIEPIFRSLFYKFRDFFLIDYAGFSRPIIYSS